MTDFFFFFFKEQSPLLPPQILYTLALLAISLRLLPSDHLTDFLLLSAGRDSSIFTLEQKPSESQCSSLCASSDPG
jgi:hypothetical protein